MYFIHSLLKLRTYWTNVHQIFTPCSQITAGEIFTNQNGDIAIRLGIKMTIFRVCPFYAKILCRGNDR